jgi:uncharacterized protein YdeI (YjbR/CyaY-like superfamily)
MKIARQLYVTTRDDWRKWLRKNHDTEEEVWLIYYRKHTDTPSIPYGDSVEEALCFGWIDSIIKRIDDERYTRRFTPRRAKSRWSELNKKRARKMIREGKMTETGLMKIREAKKRGKWLKTAVRKRKLVIPAYVKQALARNEKALANFNNLAKSYKRQYIGWITSAKKEVTRKRRLTEAIKLLEKNEKIGMK